MWRRATTGLCAAALAAAAVPPVAAASPTSPPGTGPGADLARVVVHFADDAAATARADAVAGTGIAASPPPTAAAAPGRAAWAVAASAVAEVTAEQRARLAADPRVAAVYDDVPVRADALVPTDPAWADQEGLRQVRVDEAWEQTTGDDGVVIAVVDTGVDPDTADLAGRLLPGRDFVNDDADPSDDDGHGTAAATIAAAAGGDGGIAGVCWRCRVMPVKVLDADGNGFLSDAAYGIAWAVDHGADIVNVSLGAGKTMPLLETALAAAADAGVLVVASAGNGGTTARQWPAADARAVAVAALDARGGRAGYSNHGTWIDVAAPGCNPAGWLDDATVSFCGTSSAAPVVSGVAALLASVRDVTPATAVRRAIRDTAVPLGDGVGAGRVDAVAALRALPSFDDIRASVHAAAIEQLVADRITAGCRPTRYCPGAPITRGQVATFLDRALDLPDGTAAFADVPSDHQHAAGIAAVAAAGITEGCDVARYCPAQQLRRDQMASLLARAFALPDGPARFDDVDPDDVHAPGIRAIAAARVTTGCTPDRYCPATSVTRGQMASFLVRALDR